MPALGAKIATGEFFAIFHELFSRAYRWRREANRGSATKPPHTNGHEDIVWFSRSRRHHCCLKRICHGKMHQKRPNISHLSLYLDELVPLIIFEDATVDADPLLVVGIIFKLAVTWLPSESLRSQLTSCVVAIVVAFTWWAWGQIWPVGHAHNGLEVQFEVAKCCVMRSGVHHSVAPCCFISASTVMNATPPAFQWRVCFPPEETTQLPAVLTMHASYEKVVGKAYVHTSRPLCGYVFRGPTA